MFARMLPLLFVLGLPASGTADDDQGRARAWVASGQILSLAEIIELLPAELTGQLLEAELEEEDGLPVYELEWLTSDGRVLELEIDARDGTLLSTEQERD